jgi:hypothetical protein
MLELFILTDDQLARSGQERPLRFVTDLHLFRERLGSGDRSPVFAIRSESVQKFTGRKALHFFYLNVGLPGQPYLARVEIPAWVAQDSAALDLLHCTLITQCRQLGSRPYPYALHRAHEVAVVSMDEKKQLMVMISNELRKNGIPVGEATHKQSHKDSLSVHGRYS